MYDIFFMILGFFYAIAACFLWGAIFVVPQYLPEFSLMEVALGRYASYGLLSLGILLYKNPLYYIKRYPLSTWVTAFTFALVANIVYYIGLVVGLRFATPPVTVLVIGMCPILTAFYGNLQTKETSFKALLIPCLSMGIGIILVNLTEIKESTHGFSWKEYVIGLMGATIALIAWSWFAVQNAGFLKKNNEMPRADWATLIGIGSLFWVLLFGSFFCLGNTPAIDLSKFTHFTPAVGHFLVGMAILGVLCAWLGCYLWNHASTLLPVSMMGPFIIFETIFGLAFVFLHEAKIPSLLESLGIIAMLGGITIAVFSLRKKLAH